MDNDEDRETTKWRTRGDSTLLQATAHRVYEGYEDGIGTNNDNGDWDNNRNMMGQQANRDPMMGHQGPGGFFCFFQVDFIF